MSCHDGVTALVPKLQEWSGNIETNVSMHFRHNRATFLSYYKSQGGEGTKINSRVYLENLPYYKLQ
jgi:hypothetical protein